MTTFSYPLYAGGAASVVWCWVLSGFGAMTLAFSIAEISSAYPTSGAMYFTLKYLAPKEHMAIISWIDGVLPMNKLATPIIESCLANWSRLA
jgi:amino acid transporter